MSASFPTSDPPKTFPLFLLCKLAGLLPLRFCNRPPTTIYAYLTNVALVVLFTVGKLDLLRVRKAAYSSTDSILTLLYTSLGVPDTIAVLIHLYKLRKKGQKLLMKFNDFQLKHRPLLYPKYLTSGGVVFHLSITLIVHIIISSPGPILLIISFYCNTTSFLILMLFCSYMDLIKIEMSELLPVEASSALNSVLVHLELIRKAKWATDFFSGQLLVLTTRIVLNTVIQAYIIVYNIHYHRSWERSVMMAFYLAWEICMLFIMTLCCNAVIKQAEAFDEDLYVVMRKRSDFINHDKLVLYIHRKPKVEFSCCGYFTIGKPLVTSIIAVSISYVVFLVQFSD